MQNVLLSFVMSLLACSSLPVHKEEESLSSLRDKEQATLISPAQLQKKSGIVAANEVLDSDMYHLELRSAPSLQLFKTYGVGANKLEVRLGPGKQHPLLYTLRKDAKVQIIARRGEWVQIGSSQWVLAKYLL